MKEARRRALLIVVLGQWLQERPLQVALNEALRHAEAVGLTLSMKDWVLILRALGIEDMVTYWKAKGSFTVIALPYYQQFDREMTAEDWK